MLNGEDTLEQMIASVDDGLYAVNFDGGQVDITSGKFVFCDWLKCRYQQWCIFHWRLVRRFCL
jgi:hypothetical protein